MEIVGIDLGTTNSLIAWHDGQVTRILSFLPSIVTYIADADAPVVGVEAGTAGGIGSAAAAACRSTKRLMGRGILDVAADEAALFRIASEHSDPAIVRMFCGDGQHRTPIEVAADILRALKESAERKVGWQIRDAVLTVPAYFDDAARTATRAAARLAGLNILRLINEPTAAALAYGLNLGDQGTTFAVYDLGGGTFDVSILRLYKGVLEVLATGGLTMLGGDDFDQALARHYDLVDLSLARTIKEHLTANPTYSDDDERRMISRSEAEEHCWAPLVERTIALAREVLAESGLKVAALDQIVLVGGATRMPLVRRRLEEFFGRPANSSVNPDEVVAWGAAIQGASLKQQAGLLLLDVNPLTLGIEVMGGAVEPIIPRNTTVPAMAKKVFGINQNGQKAVKIQVVQGENEVLSGCRSLATFIFECPDGMTTQDRLDVAFCLDADGLLTVTAEGRRGEQTLGAIKEVSICPAYGLAEDEIRRLITKTAVAAGKKNEEAAGAELARYGELDEG